MKNVEEAERFVEELHKKYALGLRQIALNYIGAQDADDVIQETFVEIVKNYELLASLISNKMKSYLINIVRSRAINRYRQNDRHRNHSEMTNRYADADDNIDSLPTKDESVESKVIRKIDYELCGKILQRVNERYRVVFQLKYMDFLTDDEIAKITGLSKSSIRVYIKRAIDQFKKIAIEEGTFDDEI